VGCSANILEASWQALADSLEYALLPEIAPADGEEELSPLPIWESMKIFESIAMRLGSKYIDSTLSRKLARQFLALLHLVDPVDKQPQEAG
jgi:hypothetical protein